MALNFNELEFDGVPMDEDDPSLSDDVASESSLIDEIIDYDCVYALFDFLAMVEGQVTVKQGDSLTLLDDSNSYWWLIQVLSNNQIGYIPADNVETPYEKLARVNKHKNLKLTQADPELILNQKNKMLIIHNDPTPKRRVVFNSNLVTDEFETYPLSSESDEDYEIYDEYADSDDGFFESEQFYDDSDEDNSTNDSLQKDHQVPSSLNNSTSSNSSNNSNDSLLINNPKISNCSNYNHNSYYITIGYIDDKVEEAPKHISLEINKNLSFAQVISKSLSQLSLPDSHASKYQLQVYISRLENIRIIYPDEIVSSVFAEISNKAEDPNLFPQYGEISPDSLEFLLLPQEVFNSSLSVDYKDEFSSSINSLPDNTPTVATDIYLNGSIAKSPSPILANQSLEQISLISPNSSVDIYSSSNQSPAFHSAQPESSLLSYYKGFQSQDSSNLSSTSPKIEVDKNPNIPITNNNESSFSFDTISNQPEKPHEIVKKLIFNAAPPRTPPPTAALERLNRSLTTPNTKTKSELYDDDIISDKLSLTKSLSLENISLKNSVYLPNINQQLSGESLRGSASDSIPIINNSNSDESLVSDSIIRASIANETTKTNISHNSSYDSSIDSISKPESNNDIHNASNTSVSQIISNVDNVYHDSQLSSSSSSNSIESSAASLEIDNNISKEISSSLSAKNYYKSKPLPQLNTSFDYIISNSFENDDKIETSSPESFVEAPEIFPTSNKSSQYNINNDYNPDFSSNLNISNIPLDRTLKSESIEPSGPFQKSQESLSKSVEPSEPFQKSQDSLSKSVEPPEPFQKSQESLSKSAEPSEPFQKPKPLDSLSKSVESSHASELNNAQPNKNLVETSLIPPAFSDVSPSANLKNIDQPHLKTNDNIQPDSKNLSHTIFSSNSDNPNVGLNSIESNVQSMSQKPKEDVLHSSSNSRNIDTSAQKFETNNQKSQPNLTYNNKSLENLAKTSKTSPNNFSSSSINNQSESGFSNNNIILDKPSNSISLENIKQKSPAVHSKSSANAISPTSQPAKSSSFNRLTFSNLSLKRQPVGSGKRFIKHQSVEFPLRNINSSEVTNSGISSKPTQLSIKSKHQSLTRYAGEEFGMYNLGRSNSNNVTNGESPSFINSANSNLSSSSSNINFSELELPLDNWLIMMKGWVEYDDTKSMFEKVYLDLASELSELEVQKSSRLDRYKKTLSLHDRVNFNVNTYGVMSNENLPSIPSDSFDVEKAIRSLSSDNPKAYNMLEYIYGESKNVWKRLDSLEMDLNSTAQLIVDIV
ncbi:Tip elongation aberrant protein Tea4 [Smittium culicis]|uniref:Tip elongation aberrant protein Tea4 n=1 Tax=Smittium culicis TaxID=133412 RepID=A0A1R1XDL7_9FUNG|nr:Tip elongation aberrant protein Tea4 [Smittium culicis]